MEAVRKEYYKQIMTSYVNRISDPNFFVNMDETAVYFDCKSTRTVNLKDGKKSITIGGKGSRGYHYAPQLQWMAQRFLCSSFSREILVKR